MTSPTLRALERQLKVRDPAPADSPRIYEAMQMAHAKDLAEVREAAAEEVKQAKTETTRLRADLADLHKQMQQMQEKHAASMKQMNEAMLRQQTTMLERHAAEMQRMQNEIMAAHEKAAAECEAKARAEGEVEALHRANATLQKLADRPPVVVNPAAPALPPSDTKPRSVAFQRDMNGRIVSAVLTPST